jgi:hypothetical protein
MALTAFNRELGETQGRLQPASLNAPEGTFAFVLGRDLPGLAQRLNLGDFVEVRQIADFGEAKLVRVRARLRPPARTPVGIAWRASLRVDGVTRASALLVHGRTRERVDLAANVSKLSGDHELGFRLEVVAV